MEWRSEEVPHTVMRLSGTHRLSTMDLSKKLLNLALFPVRAGLAAGGAGIEVAGKAVDAALRTVGFMSPGHPLRVGNLGDAVSGVSRIALTANELLDDDSPLTRALADGGSLNRLTLPGGLLDQVTAPGGLLDRISAEGGGLQRALAPGGLVEQMFAQDGVVDRLLAQDGVVERLLAEGGIIDRLTVRDGLLEQVADAADRLNRLSPGMEALAPTVDALRDVVTTLSAVVNPLTSIADRIPLPGVRRGRRSSTSTPPSSPRIFD